ncbi:MAG TPA: hypothetical protein ENH11_04605 [Candidatus Acetothermia bacterium]|nr:hypothetical protein [Candidatus Acetothermia bacterium]
MGVGDEVNKSGSRKPLEEKLAKFDLKLPCSSTKHALKIVPVSLTNAESGFAADTAVLTAGAKIVGRY